MRDLWWGVIPSLRVEPGHPGSAGVRAPLWDVAELCPRVCRAPSVESRRCRGFYSPLL